MVNLQGYLITAAATALIAFSTGWGVNGWRLNGKSVKEKLELSEAATMAALGELDASKALLESAAKRADSEALARSQAEERLSRAYADNAMLAQSRASTTTRIIEKGEALGQTLKTDYPCIYEPWPDRLWDYSFGSGSDQGLSRTVAGGYPSSQ